MTVYVATPLTISSDSILKKKYFHRWLSILKKQTVQYKHGKL